MKKTRINILTAAILVGALMTGCSAASGGAPSSIGAENTVYSANSEAAEETQVESIGGQASENEDSGDTASSSASSEAVSKAGSSSKTISGSAAISSSPETASSESSKNSAGAVESKSADTSASAASSGASSANTSSKASSSAVSSKASSEASNTASGYSAVISEVTMVTNGQLDTSDMFSERDLTQNADVSGAKTITVSDSSTIDITEEGVYVVTGTAKNCTIRVNADKEAKIQLVLDGVQITNDSSPAIYVVSADKCFITTTSSGNTLSVTGQFTADGDTNTDAVIYSKDDLVLNGLGTLTISSTSNGISGKDDVKITGGTYTITSAADAIEANDSIRISDGTFTIRTSKDGLHSENDEDNTVGYIYISGGSFDITASSDAVQGTTVVQIDGGTIDITASEGIEATYVQINGGTISISASDDGINASRKSSYSTPTVEFNGGMTTIVMGQGDTDAVDANGNIIVNGGTIDVTAQVSSFDYDGTAEYNGGTIIINGTQTDSIPQSMMGGMGGMKGGFSRGMR